MGFHPIPVLNKGAYTSAFADLSSRSLVPLPPTRRRVGGFAFVAARRRGYGRCPTPGPIGRVRLAGRNPLEGTLWTEHDSLTRRTLTWKTTSSDPARTTGTTFRMRMTRLRPVLSRTTTTVTKIPPQGLTPNHGRTGLLLLTAGRHGMPSGLPTGTETSLTG